MPAVNHVAKARKSPGKCGKCGDTIRKGQSYVWWAFRYGGKRVRCSKPECAPKPADLTQSEFYSTLYGIQEETFAGTTADELKDQRDSVVSELNDLAEETRGKFDNMPEGLQQGDTGQMLEERADACESAVSDLEGVDIEDEDREEDETDEAYNERNEQHLEEVRQELQDALSGISV